MKKAYFLAPFAAASILAASGGSSNELRPAPLDDATIVAIFDAANTADIETGTIATDRARRADVREYAAMLVRDHKAVRQLGRDLAAKLHVTPTPPADSSSAVAHQNALQKLRSVPQADFDRAFLEHEMAFHQSVIDAVNKTLLPAIKHDEVKALVVKVAPAFEAHRKAAEHLLKKEGE